MTNIPLFEKFEEPIINPIRPKRRAGQQKLVDFVGIFLEDELGVEIQFDMPSLNEIEAAYRRNTECGTSVKVKFKNLVETLLIGYVGKTEFWSDEWDFKGNPSRVYNMADPSFFSKILAEAHMRIAERVAEDRMVYGEHAEMAKFKGSDRVKTS